ncbi:membrane protein [Microbacterium sp. CH12i]|uniref:GtrA family protein n=1 Tax=Microbacterium sp. CH12i TaxID=1479651 RepID=UPI000460DDB4|nr:GtrA family protein [Microbacterium sp. CH12i]KDA04996.1 membrane protein [Microbacterium sp. CH12i]
MTSDLARFAVVGGVGFIIDAGVFNLLRVTVLTDGRMVGAALVAKAISVSIAILANWAGNRWWTFRDRRHDRAFAEAVSFFGVSLAGSAIALVCLGISHYALGFTSPLADNISANVIGLLLGSMFRFIASRSWVFRAAPIAVRERPRVPVRAVGSLK